MIDQYLRENLVTLEAHLGTNEPSLINKTESAVAWAGPLPRLLDNDPSIQEFARDAAGHVFGDYHDEAGLDAFRGGVGLACLWSTFLRHEQPEIALPDNRHGLGTEPFYGWLTSNADIMMLRSPTLWRCFERFLPYCDTSSERGNRAFLGFAATVVLLEVATLSKELTRAHAIADKMLFESQVAPYVGEEETLNSQFDDIANRVFRGGEDRRFGKIIVHHAIRSFLGTFPGILVETDDNAPITRRE